MPRRSLGWRPRAPATAAAAARRRWTPHKLQAARDMYASGQYTVAAIAKTLSVSRVSIYRHLSRGASAYCGVVGDRRCWSSLCRRQWRSAAGPPTLPRCRCAMSRGLSPCREWVGASRSPWPRRWARSEPRAAHDPVTFMPSVTCLASCSELSAPQCQARTWPERFDALDVGRGAATRCRASSPGPTFRFHALDVGRGAATSPIRAQRPYFVNLFPCPRCRAGCWDPSSVADAMLAIYAFPCPRCRAGCCDPCGFPWPVNRADAMACAILTPGVQTGKRHPPLPLAAPTLTCADAARQPRPEAGVPAGAVPVRAARPGGSSDDPVVLALLDHAGAQHDALADRPFVQRVDADLVLDRVDEPA
jgi:hypothetical protein